MAFYEHHSRSFVKTITYRILIIFSTAIVAFAVTGDKATTLKVTVYGNIISTVLYYLHERIWNHIHWGKTPHQKK